MTSKQIQQYKQLVERGPVLWIFKVKCAECGKLTAGRLPRAGRHEGDGTFWFPRRHKGPDGQPCPGNVEEGEVIETPTKANPRYQPPVQEGTK